MDISYLISDRLPLQLISSTLTLSQGSANPNHVLEDTQYLHSLPLQEALQTECNDPCKNNMPI